jgi:hypothetical protein
LHNKSFQDIQQKKPSRFLAPWKAFSIGNMKSFLGSRHLYAQHIDKTYKHPYCAKGKVCAQKLRVRYAGCYLLLPVFPNLDHEKLLLLNQRTFIISKMSLRQE